MTSFATHLECSRCQEDFPVDQIQQVCKSDGGPLLVRYDLRRVRDSVTKDALRTRPETLWRYRELLPYEDPGNIVSLGETNTPLLDAASLGGELGIPKLRVKDEGLLPTGTFKARGAAVGVTRAKDLGVETLALPTAGNAGAAWAAYGARAGIRVVVVMPETTPDVIIRETSAYGADVYLVPGSIADAGAVVKKACAARGWYDASTLREPYRIEGKKTMGFELAEQLDWRLPDGIVRCVVMSAAEPLEAGMTVLSAGRHVQTPVSKESFEQSVRLLTGPPSDVPNWLWRKIGRARLGSSK